MTFPACSVEELAGADVCIYRDIEEWKLVLAADAELVLRRVEVRELAAQVAGLRLAASKLDEALAGAAAARAVVEARAAELSAQVKVEHRRYEEERVRPRIGGTLGWVTAGLLGAVLAGVLVSAL